LLQLLYDVFFIKDWPCFLLYGSLVMTAQNSPLAGKKLPSELLTNIPRLITAYYSLQPDPTISAQHVSFGTSGHRGSSLDTSFNEWHILSVCQAISEYRLAQQITGPLYLGIDTHALSESAWASAVEVFAANGVELMLSAENEYVPTPAVSLAILSHNRGRAQGLADGVIITPSHNPPADGGIKYNPPSGGPAEPAVTTWIENRANDLIKSKLVGVKRVSFNQALKLSTTHRFDYLNKYVKDLSSVIDLALIRDTKIRIGVDPLGGAGVHYWGAIAEHYQLDLTVLSRIVDPTFSFMSVDWDGKIRMDPSSPYTMQSLITMKDKFDIAFACDTDHDRHGIVTPSQGLVAANHYLAVSAFYLFQNRPQWRSDAALGKTMVSSQIIDRVAHKIGRKLFEVPVGFKWFVNGLLEGSLGFVGEESAGASFLRRDGTVWTTDKDGITAALLAAEITAKTGKDPGRIYQELESELGVSYYSRVSAVTSAEEKKKLAKLSPDQVKATELAGDKIVASLTRAPANDAPLGGLKVASEHGWFAVRPSGTEDIYKIYAESFRSAEHLGRIVSEAQVIVTDAIV
jgi:phosphoglucomutase